jgi:hypothetical protein
MLTIHPNKNWIRKLTTTAAITAWILANGLDMLSMLLFLQLGGQLAFASSMVKYHPTEFTLIYAGMRTLGTLAVWLVVVLVEKHWASISHIFWNALTACALVTAVAAWLRIVQ